jgi:hypothetical protein
MARKLAIDSPAGKHPMTRSPAGGAIMAAYSSIIMARSPSDRVIGARG